MRFLALVLIGVTFGLGGAALAQPSLVVDPWGRANADAGSWFEPVAPRRDERPIADSELTDPWAAKTAAAAPVVSPLKPFDTRPVERAAAPLAPTPERLVIDPWSPVVASEIPSLREPKGAAPEARPKLVPWSDRVVEIVDPWKRSPDLASGDRIRLVIDPWMR